MGYIEKGQIVYFYTPVFEETPDERYLVIEVFEDTTGFKAKIQLLKSNSLTYSIQVVPVEDLEVDYKRTRVIMYKLLEIERGNLPMPTEKTNIEMLFGI